MKEPDEVVLRQEAINSFLRMTSYKRAERTKVIGVDRSVWSRWERGERSPSLRKIKEIAPLFGMTIAELAFALDRLEANRSQSQAA